MTEWERAGLHAIEKVAAKQSVAVQQAAKWRIVVTLAPPSRII
jgi:hypothetical protein